MTAAGNSNSRSRPLILLVDDVPENLQVVGNILQEENLDIAVAASGQEALEFIREDVPDLILLDVMMPGLDGFEVCRRLKTNLMTSSIPVIFLTARSETEDVVQGFEVGGVDYVTKPFRPAELRARVKTHLQLRQLKSVLSICSYCNRIKESPTQWERIDSYVHRQTGTNFSHCICPECIRRHAAELGLSENEVNEMVQ